MAPTQTKHWVVETATASYEGLKLKEAQLPELGDHDVLVEMKTVSLNYRDVMISNGTYMMPSRPGVVPGSDGAGVVLATGSRVRGFAPNDRVATTFFQNYIAGPFSFTEAFTDLGATNDGTLRKHGIFKDTGLVHIPSNLSFAEASTLPCAAVTAWNCLFSGAKPILPGRTVLVQGTGGVSIFALQFAVAAGAEVIATTSTAEKAAKLKALGATHVINYREDPNWGEIAKKLTKGYGADIVVEVGGPATIAQSIAAASLDGEITIVGSLSGQAEGGINLHQAMCRIRRIMVGSKAEFEAMNKAIEVNKIQPVIDGKVFQFEQVVEALKYLQEGKHVGKVVVEIAK